MLLGECTRFTSGKDDPEIVPCGGDIVAASITKRYLAVPALLKSLEG